MYINKIIAIFLTMIFITGLFPPVVIAQPNPSSLGEVKGFNKAVLDSHFSKADREISPESWLAEAKLGITQAICAWELIAAGLYENPLLFEEAKNYLEEWTNEELEKRFSQWLTGRFFGDVTTNAIMEFSQVFREAQRNYSWHLDEEGNIIFDANTGDPLVIRPNEEGREFSGDLLMWRNEADNIIKTTSASFNNIMISLYPELLAYIPAELRETMSKIINESVKEKNNAIKQEFENIAAREERIFTNRRTRDIWSLRNKSENEAARIFTERLIAETEEACKIGIEELNTRIEQAAAGTGDLALLGEEWLRLYKEQFDRGLKAWEEAEERFFIRRIEWEQESFKLLSEGEEIWSTAFNNFKEEQNKWELTAKALFETGESLFIGISEDFEKNIKKAKEEFMLNMEMRIGEGTTRVKALIDMYLICASAAISSMENLNFWYNEYNAQNKVSPDDPNFSVWLSNELKKSRSTIPLEMQKSFDMYTSYIENALYARDMILADYAELIGTGALKDILSPTASSEDFYLDEYQIALVRAKALVLYWERKTAIASDVSVYATELSAGRTTEAEGILAWEKAMTAYNESLTAYERELKSLNEIGEDIKSQQERLNNLALRMKMEEDKLNEINYEYTTYISISAASLKNYYLLDFNTKYERLVEDYKSLNKSGSDSVYKDVLRYGMFWQMSEQRELMEEAMYILINGDGNTLMSLAELRSIALENPNLEIELRVRLAAIDLLYNNDNAELRLYDSAYNSGDWYSKARGIELSNEEKSALYGKNLYSQLVEDNNKSYQMLIQKQSEFELLSQEEGFDDDIDTFLAEYYYEFYLCFGLLEMYKEYASICPFVKDEIWQNSYNSLFTLLNNYGLDSEANFLPSANSICEVISRKKGDFVQNAAQFLLEFDECFVMIPEWLENEIEDWKSSMITFISAYALNAGIQPGRSTDALLLEYNQLQNLFANTLPRTDVDEDEIQRINNSLNDIYNKMTALIYAYQITDSWENNIALMNGEKHWRQYLSEEDITNYDSALATVTTWIDGIFTDSLYYTVYYTNRVNDAFAMFLQKDMLDIKADSNLYYELYSNASSSANLQLNSLKYKINEFVKTARAYELTKISPNEAQAELAVLEGRLKDQQETYNSIRDEYLLEVESFMAIGSGYDAQYSIVKRIFDDTNEKRFEYEKQDAIKRWASTSYINADSIDLENCQAKLSRAQTVLSVLSDLYNGESKRSYEDSEYDALYSAYEESFKRKLKVLEVADSVLSTASQEYINNQRLYNEYINSLNQFGYVDQNYNNYVLPDSQSAWTVKDIITVKNGMLAFSRNNFAISGVDESKAESLNNFFNSNNDDGQFSMYEEAVRALGERMAGYFADPDKFKQWGYARNYLIYSLIKANGDITNLNTYYSGIGEMKSGGSMGRLTVSSCVEWFVAVKDDLYSTLRDRDVIRNFESLYSDAWNSLSNKEKADLEFYVILTLNGNKNSIGFSKMHTLDVYKTAYDYADRKYSQAREELDKWYNFPVFLSFEDMRDTNKNARNNIRPAYNKINEEVNDWKDGLLLNISSIQANYNAYLQSCGKLAALIGESADNQRVDWESINFTLSYVDGVSEDDINKLYSYWELMQKQEGSNRNFSTVSEALMTLASWTNAKEREAKTALETYWFESFQTQKANESIFQTDINNYIAGTGNIGTLRTTAENAFGNTSAAGKNHLDNMHTVMINNLSLYLDMDSNFFTEFSILGDELTSLTEKILRNKYNAELSAREAEWAILRMGIDDKANEWLSSAALILENGRTDWATSLQKMNSAYNTWSTNFQDEYERVNTEWTYAYLAGLEDKERWLQQVATAANNASSEAFLSLIGSEGERLSRFVDTREPFGIRDAIPTAQTLMAELLQSSGIINMSNALGSLNGIAGSSVGLVNRSMSGLSWDSALVKTAASDMARKASAEVADNESRKLIYNVRLTVEEAINGLASNVSAANQNFREGMDNHFIFNGLWRKSGNNYIKDVVKGSTLFEPVITQTVTITGYANYIMEPVSLQTNMDENYLANLDSVAIRALLNNVFIEVQTITDGIFGTGENSPGKFGAYIGSSPNVKPLEGNVGKNRNDILYDEGAGELGRLMSEYIYWSVIDSMGSAELSMAPWDKRMWNDEDSWFDAPSLRTVGTIAGSIVAGALTGGLGWAGMALSIGLSSASEIVFSSLDVATGFKTADEAAFSIGKTLLTNTISSLGGALFNGVSLGDNTVFAGLTQKTLEKASGSLNTVIAKTMMTGVQTFTTGFATSLVSGITYSEGSLGYDGKIVKAGMNSMLTNTLTSMTSTFTTSSLTAINTGTDMIKLDAFNKLNKNDVQKFNELIGSLAGQGVNYALGNDFTLNVLNLSLLSEGKYNSGLLELHLGRNGTSMNLGTGGANVSFDNLYASMRGLQVLDINTRINKYVKNENNNFDSAIALRAQYGYGDAVQKDQLRDILSGDVKLNTNAEGEYSAQTVTEDGKRVINLANYEKGMSREEQYRLAVILGHEAYRDGYGVGETDAYGNVVTYQSNFDELKEASIARLTMADKINAENDWFYAYNQDFDIENYFLLLAKESGDYSIYDEYLEFFYKNDKDYLWLSTRTSFNFQNEDRYRDIPLLNALPRERVDAINLERKRAAFGRYLSKGPVNEREALETWENFINNKDALEANGYVEEPFISLHTYGCRFMTVKYALENLMNRGFNAIELHDYIKSNNLFTNRSDLSSQNMADIITGNTDGIYTVTVDPASRTPSVQELYRLAQSGTKYFACLEVDNGNNGSHFIMLSRIKFTFNSVGEVTGISEIIVSNPWNSTGNLGRQSYAFSEIRRWDILQVQQNMTYGTSYIVDNEQVKLIPYRHN
jgi:hypothetical protein